VDIYQGLSACADDLENFGGHSLAAGLKLKAENIEDFKENFENEIGSITTPLDFLPKVFIDYELAFDDISNILIEEIELLTPFGTGNHEPLFMARNVGVESSKIVGDHHRRLRLKQGSGKTGKVFNAIQFNIEKKSVLREHFDQIAFRLRWNRWGGKKTAQMVIEET
jgi:single-stranded-DNA-specific exonuclease